MDSTKLYALAGTKTVIYGNHAGIIQSMLDFDYLCGKQEPGIAAIIGAPKRYLRYFWGKKEILVRGYLSAGDMPEDIKQQVTLCAVVQSSRRVVSSIQEAVAHFPMLTGAMIFAEGVPERQALSLRDIARQHGLFVLGPASVGLLVGGGTKLGAIGGIFPEQLIEANAMEAGSVAVISTSGGMVNELITMVARAGGAVSFAAAIGGERYPVTRPIDLMQSALQDDHTKVIVFFGELGGTDEYEIADYLKQNPSSKPVLCHVAGTIAESFETAPQFGHAKAMAQSADETASAKREVLKAAGAQVSTSFRDFETKVATAVEDKVGQNEAATARLVGMEDRKQALFASTVSSDTGGTVKVLGTDLTEFIQDKSLSLVALSMFLGHAPKSEKLSAFFDTALKLLVDHGPQVSGAVNTMITARAGKDLTAALATGLLTIGPRFGGAINQAAENWFGAVNSGETPEAFVERFAAKKEYIPGIGHKKYTINEPDPRAALLLEKFGQDGSYTQFALAVQRITTDKKAQLILNVDGLIAAMLLDILKDDEGMSADDIKTLILSEFGNAIFVYARTVGFISHYLDQKRLDEGLFRLPDDDVTSL